MDHEDYLIEIRKRRKENKITMVKHGKIKL